MPLASRGATSAGRLRYMTVVKNAVFSFCSEMGLQVIKICTAKSAIFCAILQSLFKKQMLQPIEPQVW